MTKMTTVPENYNNIHAGIVELLKTARSAAARNINSIMTATYWEIGRGIVQPDQAGEKRAEYGEKLCDWCLVRRRINRPPRPVVPGKPVDFATLRQLSDRRTSTASKEIKSLQHYALEYWPTRYTAQYRRLSWCTASRGRRSGDRKNICFDASCSAAAGAESGA